MAEAALHTNPRSHDAPPAPPKNQIVAALALDPIHIGGGSSHHGAVDMPVVRDPATRLPKIPGTSLAGPLRAAAAIQAGHYPQCAGLGWQPGSGTSPMPTPTSHCGQPDCAVCTVFGFAKGASGSAGGFAGLAAIHDMHILLFPIPTASGPVWATCPLVLESHLRGTAVADAAKKFFPPPAAGDKIRIPSQLTSTNRLDLGWLLLPAEPYDSDRFVFTQTLARLGVPEYIRDRIVIVPDKLFPALVNDNLEVRTSVSIDPTTGAAQNKALYSYEAIPRSTVFSWEFTARNPCLFRIDGRPITAVTTPDDVADRIIKAAAHLRYLGVGGMTTRGMGRIRVFPENHSPDSPSDANSPATEPTQPAPTQGGDAK